MTDLRLLSPDLAWPRPEAAGVVAQRERRRLRGFEWGIAGESPAVPLAGLTTAASFGVVPLLGGVVIALTPFFSLPFSG
uniref:Uncharacterized protein n=1 Tax=Oryza nivara TaxID=4536 RepID=A0A0E0IUK5_ORYNI